MTRHAGTVLIHRNRSAPEGIPVVSIRVRDEHSREVFEIFLAPEELAEALMDQGYQECFYIDRAGGD